MGWATEADGEVVSTFTPTAPAHTLYAIWEDEVIESTITFNANGVEATVPGALTVAVGDVVTLDGYVATTEDTTKSFVGWATTADGDAEYHAGDSFVMTAGDSQTLYAVWGDPVEYETLMTLVDAIPLIMIAGLIVTIVGTVFIGRYVGMSIEDMVRLVLGACIAVLFVVAIAIPIISGL